MGRFRFVALPGHYGMCFNGANFNPFGFETDDEAHARRLMKHIDYGTGFIMIDGKETLTAEQIVRKLEEMTVEELEMELRRRSLMAELKKDNFKQPEKPMLQKNEIEGRRETLEKLTENPEVEYSDDMVWQKNLLEKLGREIDNVFPAREGYTLTLEEKERIKKDKKNAQERERRKRLREKRRSN